MHPQVHYETEAIILLQQLVEEAMAGEDVFAEMDQRVDELAEIYSDFDQQHIQPFLESLLSEAADDPSDPFPHQLSYALKTGAERFDSGRAQLIVAESPEELQAAFAQLQDGHDYIYFAVELVSTRVAERKTRPGA